MKRKTISLLGCFGLLFVLGAGQKAHAGFMFEPYLGYGFNSQTNAGTGSSFNGVQLGARAGMKFAGMLFVAADFQYGLDSYSTGGSAGVDAKHLLFGATMGVSFPAVPFRFWGGYNFVNELKYSNTDTGGGLRLGVGYSFFPMMSVNFDYMIHNFNQRNGAALTGTTSSTVMFSVSAPLSI